MATRAILIVEDDITTSEGYREWLTREGFKVKVVESGERALNLASRDTCDLIVLDLDLPDIDGWEVARRLQADSRTQNIPIICVSGHTRQHEQASSLRAGCSVFLPKPFAPQELLNWIDRLTKFDITRKRD